MIVTKNISFGKLLAWTGPHLIWLTVVMTSVALLYYFGYIHFVIPWLPVSVIGTAVAFYVGFKNNQAYSRMWEARKVWGAIVNDSRTWGMLCDTFISNLHRDEALSDEEIKSIKRRLIYRHIAWLYAHRQQLLVVTEWEHANQSGHVGRTALRYQSEFGIGLLEEKVDENLFKSFISVDEFNRFIKNVNPAAQIINEQGRDLHRLREMDVIDNFKLIQMTNVLRGLYEHQGKNERIKKFPLPRQYANISRYFVGIFIILLPFSMVPALIDAGPLGVWLSIPLSVLIGWVYVMMEIIGDYSENPFQGMANDIPMMSLCRTIEIDLREMLEETDLPPGIKSKNGVLM